MKGDSAVGAGAVSSIRKPGGRKLSRSERSQRIREELFRAAARIVGEVGYSNAMVSKITEAANVAQGTFYNHFESRQQIFDELLPRLGSELLGYIRARTHGVEDPVERERLGFIAFFEFLQQKPEFYRILYEAEVFAPVAFDMHMDRISASYVRALERDMERGALNARSRDDLEVLAFSLMGMRHYLCMRFARRNGRIVELPGWVIECYMNFVREGLYRS